MATRKCAFDHASHIPQLRTCNYIGPKLLPTILVITRFIHNVVSCCLLLGYGIGLFSRMN